MSGAANRLSSAQKIRLLKNLFDEKSPKGLLERSRFKEKYFRISHCLGNLYKHCRL